MFDAWIDKYKTVRKPTERVAGYRYAPFGAVAQAVGACAATNPFRFRSEYADDELGLVYYNYRHYNPLDGRWLRRAVIGTLGGRNPFCFARNSSCLVHDLLGLYSVSGPYNRLGKAMSEAMRAKGSDKWADTSIPGYDVIVYPKSQIVERSLSIFCKDCFKKTVTYTGTAHFI